MSVVNDGNLGIFWQESIKIGDLRLDLISQGRNNRDRDSDEMAT